MAGAREHGNWRDVERILARLAGADGAAVTGNGGIDRVRLVPADNPDEAVWGARAALAAATGHLLPEDDVDTAPELDVPPGRWILTSIHWTRVGERSEVFVRLEECGRCTEGRRQCASGDLVRGTAEATVTALQEALAGECLVSLLDLKRVEIAGIDAWLAAVSVAGPGRRQVLLGTAAAPEGRNRLEAVARAVLDGMNRAFRKPGLDGDRRTLASFFGL